MFAERAKKTLKRKNQQVKEVTWSILRSNALWNNILRNKFKIFLQPADVHKNLRSAFKEKEKSPQKILVVCCKRRGGFYWFPRERLFGGLRWGERRQTILSLSYLSMCVFSHCSLCILFSITLCDMGTTKMANGPT